MGLFFGKKQMPSFNHLIKEPCVVVPPEPAMKEENIANVDLEFGGSRGLPGVDH